MLHAVDGKPHYAKRVTGALVYYLCVPPCATHSPSMQKMVLPIHSLLLETDAPALVRRCSHTTQCHACCHMIAGNMVLTLSVGRKAGYCGVSMSAETEKGVVNVPTALPVSRGQVAVFKSLSGGGGSQDSTERPATVLRQRIIDHHHPALAAEQQQSLCANRKTPFNRLT